MRAALWLILSPFNAIPCDPLLLLPQWALAGFGLLSGLISLNENQEMVRVRACVRVCVRTEHVSQCRCGCGPTCIGGSWCVCVD